MDNARVPEATFARKCAAWLSDAFAVGGGYPLLLTLTFLMEVRWSVASALPGSDVGALRGLDHVNYLRIAEWLCILDIARGADWSRTSAGRLERSAGLSLAIYAGVFVAPTSHYLTALLGMAIAFKAGFIPNLRPLSACLLLVNLQVLPRKEFYGLSLNELSTALDALGAHYLLLVAGYMNEATGTVIRLQNSAHAIEIGRGCATVGPLFEVLAAYGVFAIWLRSHPRRALFFAGALVIAVVQVNWLRLAVMAISKPSYDYWHYGPGAPIISFCYTLLAFSFAKMGARATAGGVEAPATESFPSLFL